MTPVEADPYNKMLSKSLRNNGSVLQEDPFKRTSLRKNSNDGQQILDNLKGKKGELIDLDNK